MYHSSQILYFSSAMVSICRYTTINSEMFASILFSRISLKDIFATAKIREKGIIYLQSDLATSNGFYFHESFSKISECTVSTNTLSTALAHRF